MKLIQSSGPSIKGRLWEEFIDLPPALQSEGKRLLREYREDVEYQICINLHTDEISGDELILGRHDVARVETKQSR